MGTSVRSASLQDRSDLVRFGNSCIDLLMLDYLWTLAVETKDPEAAGIGRRMLALIGTMRHEGGRASELVRSSRVELNSTWPQIREQHRLPQEQMAAIDGFIKEYGGLGDAGFSVAQELDNTLGAEASAIAGKIADFERGGGSAGDMSRRGKIMLGVFGICVFAVVAFPIATGALPLTLAGVGAALIWSSKDLALVCAGVAGSEIVRK